MLSRGASSLGVKKVENDVHREVLFVELPSEAIVLGAEGIPARSHREVISISPFSRFGGVRGYSGSKLELKLDSRRRKEVSRFFLLFDTDDSILQGAGRKMNRKIEG